MHQPLVRYAHEIAALLLKFDRKIVFAESCTGGLISALLATAPGISNVHCGSAVVYRLNTKTQWLEVPESMLNDSGPVSEPVARAMVEGVLRRTPEAEIGVSITGHLGPNAPEPQDGLVFVGFGVRGETCRVVEHRLPKYDLEGIPFPYPGETEREQRQSAAAEFVFSQLEIFLRAIALDY